MGHRDRLLLALNHREPDRVPIDLGAALACSINVQTYDRLKRHLGLATASPTLVCNRLSQVAAVDDEILQRFQVDVQRLRPGGVGDGTPAGWDEAWDDERDEWGVLWQKPASGHARDYDSPLRGEAPTVADLSGYPWPDPDDPARLAGLREEGLRLRSQTDCGVALALSLYPYDQCHLLRGYANWFLDLAANRRFAEALLDQVTGLMVAMLKPILDAVGDLVDVVCWGDDVSNQRGPMMRPDLYVDLIKPRHRRMVDAIRRGTDAKVFFHTDGSVRWLIGHLIDVGIDIINPVQVGAADMDLLSLKRDFGRDICFWGAGCDSQHVLPSGTPEQVRDDARRNIDALAPGGGFVFAPIHHIESEVPAENVVAMYDAALEFGRYR